jgi:hypothetical protein
MTNKKPGINPANRIACGLSAALTYRRTNKQIESEKNFFG